MDKDKETILVKIQDDAQSWLEPSRIGDTIRKYHETEIELYRARIESDAFVSNHDGYLLALAGLQVSKRCLTMINSAETRYNKATQELEELRETTNGA